MFDDLSFILKLFVVAFGIFIVVGVLSYVQKKKQEKEKREFERYKKEQQRKHEREEAERQELGKRADAHRRRIEREKETERRKIEREREEQTRKQLEELTQHKKDEFNQMLASLKRYKIEFTDEKHNRNSSIYVECKNVTKSTSLNKIKDFIAIDTETTGLKAVGNDVIQLSAIKFQNFEPVEIFSTYLKPRKSIPDEAAQINGITDEMVADAPKFCQIINSLNDFIGDLPLVAHNAPFDMKHLYANGLDSIENKIVYDTLELSKKIIPDAYSYKLGNICEQCHIYFDNAHNSDSDSLAAGLLFVQLVCKRKETTAEELISIVG